MNVHTLDIAGTQYPFEDTQCRGDTEQNTEDIAKNKGDITTINTEIENLKGDISTLQNGSYYLRRKLNTINAQGVFYDKLSGLFPSVYNDTNVFLLTDRNGEYRELACSTTDGGAVSGAYEITFNSGANKITAIYRDGADIYIRRAGYSKISVQQKSGIVTNFTLTRVSSIPSTATLITNNVVSYAS